MKKIILTIAGIILPAMAQAQSSTAANYSLNPLGDTSGGGAEIYGRLLRFLLGFVGVGSLVFFIIGGIMMLTSRGNPEQIKKGRDTIVWAIIGVLVAFTSYILLRFVIETIITPL